MRQRPGRRARGQQHAPGGAGAPGCGVHRVRHLAAAIVGGRRPKVVSAAVARGVRTVLGMRRRGQAEAVPAALPAVGGPAGVDGGSSCCWRAAVGPGGTAPERAVEVLHRPDEDVGHPRDGARDDVARGTPSVVGQLPRRGSPSRWPTRRRRPGCRVVRDVGPVALAGDRRVGQDVDVARAREPRHVAVVLALDRPWGRRGRHSGRTRRRTTTRRR